MSGQFRPISAVSPARLLSSKLGAVIEIGSCPKGIKCYKKKIHIENCTNTKVISPCIHLTFHLRTCSDQILLKTVLQFALL